MVVISYIKLYKKMQEEGFSALQAFRNMGRIRKMDPSILKALQEWLEGGYPVLTVNGVSFEELVEEEDMNPIRAFLMLDWKMNIIVFIGILGFSLFYFLIISDFVCKLYAIVIRQYS